MRTIYALTPESRTAVDAAARRVHTYADSWQLESTASAFRVMGEIYMADGVLRVALRDAAADEPVAVTTCAGGAKSGTHQLPSMTMRPTAPSSCRT